MGSSSNRSSEIQATGRFSLLTHSASSIDLPYPAGAVTLTIRRALERAVLIRSARLTAPLAEYRGGASFASSNCRSSSTSGGTSAGDTSRTIEA